MTIEIKVTATVGNEGDTLNVSFEEDYKILDVMHVLEMIDQVLLKGIKSHMLDIVKSGSRRNLSSREIDKIIANTTVGKSGL